MRFDTVVRYTVALSSEITSKDSRTDDHSCSASITRAPALCVCPVALASFREQHFASSNEVKTICGSCLLMGKSATCWEGWPDSVATAYLVSGQSCSLPAQWGQNGSHAFRRVQLCSFCQHHPCPLFLLSFLLTFPSLNLWIPFGIHASFIPIYTKL